MAKGDRGSRGRSEYGSGSDHRRGTTYRDRDRADRNRDRYEQQQKARDEQRKREEAARREAEKKESERKIRQAQQSRERQRTSDQRRAAVSGQTSGFGSVLDRIGDVFSTEGEPTDITDSEGNVVAQSFGGIEEPTKFKSIDFTEKEGFETAVPDANPYSEYARTVVSTGPVGESPQEKEVQQQIYDAGKSAQTSDIFGSLASAAAGPLGSIPGVVSDVVNYVQDDPIQQAGEDLYESGKVDIPGVSTVLSATGIPGLGAAFEVANSIFGGSTNLDAFKEKTGVVGPEIYDSPADGGNRDTQYASNVQPIQQPIGQPQTMADGFQMASWDQNIYSDFLNNFFKQGA